MLFRDRFHAGRQLANKVREYTGRDDLLILALPRGGVPVAFAVAQELRAPLDVFLVRKLGVPGQEELAMGAVASGGLRFVNTDVVRELAIADSEIDRIAAEELLELERRDRLYRGDQPHPHVAGKIVILIDDGLATGASMRAAVLALRPQAPSKIIVAVPVAAAATCELLRSEADEVICLATPERFFAVGQWYEDFSQTSDDEVRELLRQAQRLQQSAVRTQSAPL